MYLDIIINLKCWYFYALVAATNNVRRPLLHRQALNSVSSRRDMHAIPPHKVTRRINEMEQSKEKTCN